MRKAEICYKRSVLSMASPTMVTVHQACFLVFFGGFAVVFQGVRGVPSCSSRLSNIFNISASSFKDRLHSPQEARTDGTSSWCAKRSDLTSPWIQVSFSEKVRVTGMKIQGSKTEFIWVKKYRIEYKSSDGRWTKYGKVLIGNSFSDYPSGKVNTFSPPLLAHDVRVYPLEAQGITTGKEEVFAPCLRMEFYGCRVLCPDPGQPKHGMRIGQNFLDGMTVTFTCTRSGYDLFGARSLRCINGTWDKPTPSCKAQCTYPGIPRNGLAVKINLRHSGITRFVCRRGFKLQGVAKLTCKNGRWNRRLPLCIADDDDDDDSSGSGSKALCSNPGIPVNGGRRGNNFIEGQTVQFFCQKNFTLFGDSQITCINGSWSGLVPQCRVKCKDPGTPLNGGRHGNNFAEGQRVMYFCHKGYDLIGIEEPMCIAGQWSSVRPVCKTQGTKCKRPNPLPNARIYGSKKQFYDKGERLLQLCLPGYFSHGSGVRICQETNTWSNSLFRCAPKSCGDPGIPGNGYKDGLVYKTNSKVYYSCYPGHEMHGGSSVRECLINGSWTGSKPQCRPVDCGDLPTPSNGIKELTQTTFLGRAKFRCTRRGYVLIGSPWRECQANGNWSGIQPQCKKKLCKRISSPVNGVMRIHGNYTYRSSAIFLCNKGHVMEGSDRSVCLDDGTWSSPVPKCKRIIKCPRRWIKYNGACYLFKHKTRRSQSWTRLKTRCKSYKASLLRLHDNSEWNFVKRHLKSKVPVYGIGLRQGRDGVWRWSGGSMLTTSKWDTSQGKEPNSKRKCGVIQASNALFKAVSCNQKLRAYVCKKN